MLLDVPDGFFTVTFPMLGFLLALSKSFVRVRMEERAWEQRLEEARQEKLLNDPTLTELQLRRQEAAQEWSAYGQPRWDELAVIQRRQKQQEQQQQQQLQQQEKSESRYYDTTKSMDRGRKRRTQVFDRDDEMDTPRNDNSKKNLYQMNEEEIQWHEAQYGIQYDPYYDDPYTIDELPEGPYNVDKQYGDRVYPNGEIFYKDRESGFYYRQGAKPRSIKFW
jgi:hypothetical protein